MFLHTMEELLPPEIWKYIHSLHCFLKYYHQWCIIVEQLRTQENTHIIGYPSCAQTLTITQAMVTGRFRMITKVDLFHWVQGSIVMIEFGEYWHIIEVSGDSVFFDNDLLCLGICYKEDTKKCERYIRLEKLLERGRGLMSILTIVPPHKERADAILRVGA